MNYNELKKVVESKKFTIKEVADKLGMTSNGVKRSIENETMSIGKVRELCGLLELSIAEFFGETVADIEVKNSSRSFENLTEVVLRQQRMIEDLQSELDELRGDKKKSRTA